MGIAAAPPVDHGISNLWVKLHPDGRIAVDYRLVLKGAVRCRKHGCSVGALKPLTMPMVDACRPIPETACGGRWTDRIIADFHALFGVLINAGTQISRQHLRAEANPEKWLILLECNANPFRFDLAVIVGIVGAHRSAENDRAGMILQCIGQRLAET